MKLLRAATVTVSDLNRSKDLYSRYFDYSVVEEGTISDALAASWGAPKSTGQPYIVMQPSSGAEVYVRFVEQPAVDGFKALRSYGWNAIEICVQDVMAVNARMTDSPFEDEELLTRSSYLASSSLVWRKRWRVAGKSVKYPSIPSSRKSSSSS